MSAIDDNKLLAEISIPGSHNSMSLYGGDVTATQTLSITSQLNMGIRYLDARFKYDNNQLFAYHGIIYQHITFDEFLYEVSSFLDSNPTETILIRIQNEAGAEINSLTFYQYFLKALSQYKHNNIVPYNNNPRLGDVRGKFIFIEDFNANQKIGIHRRTLNIQDDHHLNSNWDLYGKWEKIKHHFKTVKSDQISLNYLSGSYGSFPYFVASRKSSHGSHDDQLWTGDLTTNKAWLPDFPRANCTGALCSVFFLGTNQLTSKWIEQDYLPDNLGIVIADFPGGKLVNNIIQTNNRNYKKLTFNLWNNSKKGNIEDIYIYSNPYNHKVEFFKLKNKYYGYLPTQSNSNNDWDYLGLKKWGEKGKIGDIYKYDNPYTGTIDLFMLKGNYQTYFPTNKKNNNNWEYIKINTWKDGSIGDEKKGSLYKYNNPHSHQQELFLLLKDGSYSYFPINQSSNEEWYYLGVI